MARITFVTPDGVEQSYTLDKTATLRIGRDPSNDIVLRDARVSRQHAELAFERGFFVLKDSGSANGVWVNGQRVRTAPLTDQAELRLGNTSGRFWEDKTLDESGTLAIDLFKTTASEHESDKLKLPPFPEAPLGTRPMGNEPARSGKQEGAAARRPGSSTRIFDAIELQSAGVGLDPRYTLQSYWFDIGAPYGEVSTIRDGEGEPLFYFRRPANLVGFFAALVSWMILLAGLATSVVLATGDQFVPGLIATLITIGFSIAVLLLVPRRHIYICDDPQLTQAALMIWQESRFAFPVARFTVRTPDGRSIGCITKTGLGNLGRRCWAIFDGEGRFRIGEAREVSLLRSLMRKAFGFFGAYHTDFEVVLSDGSRAALVNRRATFLNRYALELEQRTSADPRLLLAVGTVIDAMERL